MSESVPINPKKPRTNMLLWLFRKTLNNVIFGVALMVLIGLYIAVGSGLPSVREYFELNDLQFFNAWPLKLLMALLVANLSVVTWMRIPLTWPRLGVWMIHTGIVTLIFGTSFYYKHKVEGQIHIRRGQTVGSFYDSAERSLFVRVNGQPIFTNLPLESLPRFQEHPADASGGALRRDLKDIELAGLFADDSGQPVVKKLSDLVGLKSDLTVDVIGYHPYADIQVDYTPDPSSNTAGIQLGVPDPHSGKVAKSWLVASDSQNRTVDLGGVTVEHRDMPMRDITGLLDSGKQIHRLDVKIGDYAQSLFVEIGQKYELGSTGYSFSVENFDPAWSTFETHEKVRALSLLIKNSKAGGEGEFRRMVLEALPGRTKYNTQTDFKLNVPGAPPFGKRQDALLANLQIGYSFNDPNHLLPFNGVERHMLITSDRPGITHVAVSGDGTVKEQPVSPTGEFFVGPEDVKMKLSAERVDHLLRRETVIDVPPVKRTRDTGAAGVMQVVTLRVKSGDWSQVVNVPYVSFALEPDASWSGVRSIMLPGTMSRLQIALGNTRLKLPARLTLQNFELVNYPGGTINDNLFRDFKSTLKVVSNETGEEEVGVAKMNNPIYFDSGNWLFFQSGYDKQEMSTFIGVGNRPGVAVMTFGCILMAVGLMYAFYLKPIIIRRRKMRAIAIAQAAGKMPPAAKQRKRKPVVMK